MTALIVAFLVVAGLWLTLGLCRAARDEQHWDEER